MPRNIKSVDFDEETLARIENLRQQKGLPSFKAAEDFIHAEYFKGKTVSDESIPENCKSCPKFGNHVKNGKVLCLTKKTLAEPVRSQWIPLDVAHGCSEMPFNTPINKKTREQFEKDLSNVENMKLYHQKRADELRPKAERLPIVERQLEQTMRELEEATKGKEDLLSTKSTLRLRVSNMENALLEGDKKIASLETDNGQLRKEIEELSHDRLFEENQLFKVQLSQKERQVANYQLEVQKEQALREKAQEEKTNIVKQTLKMLNEFKAFMPSELKYCEQCTQSFTVMDYLRNIQKKIEQFEGYVNTVAP
jgi:hypothetical protein